MFGLIRFSTIADKVLREILIHARSLKLEQGTESDDSKDSGVHNLAVLTPRGKKKIIPGQRMDSRELMQHCVHILAVLTPRRKKHWVVQKLKKLSRDEPDSFTSRCLSDAERMLEIQLNDQYR